MKVLFVGFLLALPLQNLHKASVEQPQVRVRLKFASVCKFDLAYRLVVKGFYPYEPLRKAIACGLPRKAFALFAMTADFCHFERSEKSKEFKIRFIFGYFACAQYDKFRLSPKFFETKEKFKEFKEFAIFLKKFY